VFVAAAFMLLAHRLGAFEKDGLEAYTRHRAVAVGMAAPHGGMLFAQPVCGRGDAIASARFIGHASVGAHFVLVVTFVTTLPRFFERRLRARFVQAVEERGGTFGKDGDSNDDLVSAVFARFDVYGPPPYFRPGCSLGFRRYRCCCQFC
jgi:hypothetical protein